MLQANRPAPLLATVLAGMLVTGCQVAHNSHQPAQQKTQVYRQKAQVYLRHHRAEFHHARARALRYTRLKMQRARCRLHPTDKRACGQLAPPHRHGAKHE